MCVDLIFMSAQVKNELTIGVWMSPASVKQYWSLIPDESQTQQLLFEVHADVTACGNIMRLIRI